MCLSDKSDGCEASITAPRHGEITAIVGSRGAEVEGVSTSPEIRSMQNPLPKVAAKMCGRGSLGLETEMHSYSPFRQKDGGSRYGVAQKRQTGQPRSSVYQ